MFPSHAKMYLAPIRTQTSAKKREEFEDSCVGWDEFADETLQNYGVDMRSLTETFEQEQREFFLNTSAWVDVHPSQVLGAPCVLRDFDLHTVTLEEMRNLDVPFNLRVMEAAGPAGPAEVGAFCGWFDVSFKGSSANPNETDVELTTAPDANGATHWGQQAFYLDPTLSAADGNVIAGRLELKRKAENQRLYDLRLTWKQGADEGGLSWPTRQSASSATCGTSSDGRVYRRCDSTCVTRPILFIFATRILVFRPRLSPDIAASVPDGTFHHLRDRRRFSVLLLLLLISKIVFDVFPRRVFFLERVAILRLHLRHLLWDAEFGAPLVSDARGARWSPRVGSTGASSW